MTKAVFFAHMFHNINNDIVKVESDILEHLIS